MSQTYEVLDVNAAISKLQKLKKRNRNAKIIICTIDFDNGEENKKKCCPEEGGILIRNSSTIIFNGDDFLSHMELYSLFQSDITNIIKEGVMHDIIWFEDKIKKSK